MKADISFPVTRGGRVGVPSPGLYLIYVQVLKNDKLDLRYDNVKLH